MPKKRHAERAHAKLSASGSHRWLECPPSAKLEDMFPDESTVYSREGTLAHEYSEAILRKKMGIISSEEFEAIEQRIRKDDLFQEEMVEYVHSYVDVVLEKFSVAMASDPNAMLLIEQRLDFSSYVPDGFGTGDACIIAAGVCDVIDLKYGKGVEVSAHMNPQLMLYGLGAVISLDVLCEFDHVTMTIVQPRLDHVDSFKMSVPDLLEWANKTVKPIAEKAHNGEGEQKVGEWCRFCKAKARCKAQSVENTKLAQYDFKDPLLICDEELLDIYKRTPRLVEWAEAVSQLVRKEALAGKKWDGLKLVPGRATRYFTEEASVVKKLTDDGYTEDKIYNKKLKGIGDIEKLVGKKNFDDLLGTWVDKKIGEPSLVPENDPRNEVKSSAEADFAN